ncbi:hypothetical protein DFR52_1011031 [Hoeflea marina]|uniref:t-SNARE coiled-coil homology domain-containing protein n=1 Tax=Hoeflea marina TaxID=274592 RepID=A0A317PVM9_9HYPH|nr:hypothetical protein [Hoeflea marina]PWW04336.1 hypothetical protein DFR52_1011031 [Hoeflea marina]
MAEVTNELIFDVLKQIQTRMTHLDDGQQEIKGRIGSLSEQVRGLASSLNAAHTDIGNIYLSLDKLDQHVHRIEKRLELADHPAE